MAKSKKVKPITLPDGFADINPIPDSEFAPKQSTMDRFADRYELQLACDKWLRIVFEPPAFMAEEPYPDFDDLTQALMLWASLQELGDGWQLMDAAMAAYRREPIGAVWRAQAFIELIKNRSMIPRPTAAAGGGQRPMGEPELVDERYAAREILKVSERTLWTLRDQGAIPHVRIGHSVRYNLDDLRRWIEANKQHGKHRNR
jgi:hypothetical protein